MRSPKPLERAKRSKICSGLNQLRLWPFKHVLSYTHTGVTIYHNADDHIWSTYHAVFELHCECVKNKGLKRIELFVCSCTFSESTSCMNMQHNIHAHACMHAYMCICMQLTIQTSFPAVVVLELRCPSLRNVIQPEFMKFRDRLVEARDDVQTVVDNRDAP